MTSQFVSSQHGSPLWANVPMLKWISAMKSCRGAWRQHQQQGVRQRQEQGTVQERLGRGAAAATHGALVAQLGWRWSDDLNIGGLRGRSERGEPEEEAHHNTGSHGSGVALPPAVSQSETHQ